MNTEFAMRRIEESSLNAWPALNTYVYDGWLLRLGRGYSKRANSVNVLYASELPIEPKIEVCERIYRTQQMRPTFRLTPLAPQDLDQILVRRHYSLLDETNVKTLSLHGNLFDFPSEAVLYKGQQGLSQWLDAFHRLSPGRTDRTAHGKILARIAGEVAPLVLKVGNDVVACGLGVLQDDLLGLFDIVTGKDYRRQGYGRKITNALLSWGQSKGASLSYLQVVAENLAATNLYDAFGYSILYQYHYRVLPL